MSQSPVLVLKFVRDIDSSHKSFVPAIPFPVEYFIDQWEQRSGLPNTPLMAFLCDPVVYQPISLENILAWIESMATGVRKTNKKFRYSMWLARAIPSETSVDFLVDLGIIEDPVEAIARRENLVTFWKYHNLPYRDLEKQLSYCLMSLRKDVCLCDHIQLLQQIPARGNFEETRESLLKAIEEVQRNVSTT